MNVCLVGQHKKLHKNTNDHLGGWSPFTYTASPWRLRSSREGTPESKGEYVTAPVHQSSSSPEPIPIPLPTVIVLFSTDIFHQFSLIHNVLWLISPVIPFHFFCSFLDISSFNSCFTFFSFISPLSSHTHLKETRRSKIVLYGTLKIH